MEIFDDLVDEQDRLEGILGDLDEEAWRSPSGAPGWTIADVVLHLAQTEEAVVATIGLPDTPTGYADATESIDDAMGRLVQAERAEPMVVLERWRAARRAAVDALRAAQPERPVRWAAAPLKPATLATTRLAEHWAHGLDITEPLAVPFPDTDRLRHIAWLGHGTLPYAFGLAGQQPREVFCELLGPSGSTWRYGPPEAASSIRGEAGAFCRVGAQRLAPEASGLRADGPYGSAALAVLRNYAG